MRGNPPHSKQKLAGLQLTKKIMVVNTQKATGFNPPWSEKYFHGFRLLWVTHRNLQTLANVEHSFFISETRYGASVHMHGQLALLNIPQINPNFSELLIQIRPCDHMCRSDLDFLQVG